MCVAKTSSDGNETRLPCKEAVLNQSGRFAPAAVAEIFPQSHNFPFALLGAIVLEFNFDKLVLALPSLVAGMGLKLYGARYYS